MLFTEKSMGSTGVKLLWALAEMYGIWRSLRRAGRSFAGTSCEVRCGGESGATKTSGGVRFGEKDLKRVTRVLGCPS